MSTGSMIEGMDGSELVEFLVDATSGDLEASFQRVSGMVARALRAPVAQVNVIRDQEQVSLASFGSGAWHGRRRTSLDFSYCRHVVSTGVPLLIEDSREHPLVATNRSTTESGLASYAGVPLALPSGAMIGSLCAFDFAPREWSADDAALLEDFAEWVVAEITRFVQSRASLRESAERYQALFEYSPMGIVIYDEDLIATSINDRVLAMFGIPPDAVRAVDVDLKQLSGEVPMALQRVLAGMAGRYEGPFTAASTGVTAWVSVHAWPLRNARGGVAGGIAIVEDLTQHRRVEQEARTAKLEILERLAQAAEFRDEDTGEHTRRVGELAARLAAAVGLPQDEVDLIRRAAPLHDVGKIGVPDGILLKPGRLSPDEFETMKGHTLVGGQILAGGQFPLMSLAETIARSHHERWDGSGYPDGLSGEAIPLPARIVALADFFDALTHDRPYRQRRPVPEVLTMIREGSGSHFDPALAEAFLQILSADDATPSP